MKKNKPGQGRKNPYGEPTKQVQSKVPESKVEEFKQIVHKQLKKWHMKKFLIACILLYSCTTTRPAIINGNLINGKDTSTIQYGPTGRAYVVKDGVRHNLFRKP